MKEKTMIKEYNKAIDNNLDLKHKNNKLNHELNDLYAEFHIAIASGFEHDNEMSDIKSKMAKYKNRASITDHKYKSVLGRLIKTQHILNRNSDNEMEFH